MVSDSEVTPSEELIPGLQASSVENTSQETGIDKIKVFLPAYNSNCAYVRCFSHHNCFCFAVKLLFRDKNLKFLTKSHTKWESRKKIMNLHMFPLTINRTLY